MYGLYILRNSIYRLGCAWALSKIDGPRPDSILGNPTTICRPFVHFIEMYNRDGCLAAGHLLMLNVAENRCRTAIANKG
ncbi:unnamed protein product [Protopolystoma xenopodis]|uniref:Uncharacterized protein n=1 Tax=Protopolystoma xenopodis TaxID=117903 RepID=A0A3S5CV37_9PLAT|nr:unnamed protein product [Protopolystoma xenopodis]